MILCRRNIIVTKDYQLIKSFTIWQYFLKFYGRSIYLEKEIQERQPYFLSSIFTHLDLMQPMIYLRKMHGISEMHWFGQIIMI